MVKYKSGDKVLLKNQRGKFWNPQGEMDKFINRIVTIKEFLHGGFNSFKICKIWPTSKTPDSYWVFTVADIECKILNED